MVSCPFDFSTVAFGRRVIEYQADGYRIGDDGCEVCRDDIDHLVEEFRVLVSDVGHVVEYLSVVIVEMGGLYPLSDGSSSVEGKQHTEDEW